jgi:hypothetical protein
MREGLQQGCFAGAWEAADIQKVRRFGIEKPTSKNAKLALTGDQQALFERGYSLAKCCH